MQLCAGGKHAGGNSSGKIWTDYNSHDPGAPSLPPTLDSAEPGPVPTGIEHEDIGGASKAPRKCVCIDVPIPCGSCPGGFKTQTFCGGHCGGGGGHHDIGHRVE